MPQNKKTLVLILLSGGIDSSACINFYKENDCSVEALFIDHGQLAAAKEIDAARKIAAYFNIHLRCLRLLDAKKKKVGEIIARNAFLIQTALMECSRETNIIGLGIHAGTSYYDCSAPFLKSMQDVANGYTSGCVKIEAPFINWNKLDIWRYLIHNKIPYELTYSCEKGTDPPCGKCLSCQDIKELAKWNS